MEYLQRIEKVRKRLPELNCDCLLVDDKVNLYYLTGLQLSVGQLIIHTKGANLLVDNRYFELCKKKCPVPVALSSQNALKQLFMEECSFVNSLGFNSETTSYKSFLELKKNNTHINGRRLSLQPIDNIVKSIRSIKDKEEITLLEEAGILGSFGFDFVCDNLREGITEIELANRLEIFWKQRGSKTVAFDPIIAFGPNSSMPHYRAGDAVLKKGSVVLIDIGVNLKHYHSDMSRVVYFGEPDPQMLVIHQIVEQAQRAALELCRPGTLIGDLDRTARDLITEKGYGEYFIHSLGHGVGLEIHELPVLRNVSPYKEIPLQEGMVITIEPGIYLPDLGGVRIEDTVVITSSGYKNLTNRPTDICRI